MSLEQTTAIAELLAQAGNAHHHYEQTILNGVYHEEWADWYADYAIAHGLNSLLTNPLTVDQLSHFLSEITDHHKSENSTSATGALSLPLVGPSLARYAKISSRFVG